MTNVPGRDTQPPMTETQPGSSTDLVPGYELCEEIGRGGMGVVHRARDVQFDRDVAVKLLAAQTPADARTATRFRVEARITGQLQHPGIPAVHELGTLADGRPFLAMKLVKGRTLQMLLDDDPKRQKSDGLEIRPTDEDGDGLKIRPTAEAERGRFIAIFEQVCHAVGYAHAHRVIHRDLKPANVMVGAFGEVQVMDWGLAKVLPSGGRESPESTDDTDLSATVAYVTEIDTPVGADSATRTGSILGTPAYMPPEQAAGQIRKLDPQSDVFGLGAMLCVILTGKPP